MTRLQSPQGGILWITLPDNPYQLLIKTLTEHGVGLSVINDNTQLLQQICEFSPEIILLSAILPSVSGFEIYQVLKADPTTADLPVIFVTNRLEPAHKAEAYQRGAAGYLIEPLSPQELLAACTPHLNLSALHQIIAAQETTIAQARREKQGLLADFDTFAVMAAHNLRNSLNATISYAEYLKKFQAEMTAEEVLHDLNVISQNGQKMERILKELLLLVNIRTEKAHLEPLDMESIIFKVQRRLAPLLEAYEANVTLPPEWPEALGHSDWIGEVWLNYIGNAIKYGGQPAQVEIGDTVQDEGWVQFWVRDNGTGLTAEQMETLFPPFTQLNQVKVKGSGLGLVVVGYIIEKLGGKVEVVCDERGTIFSFYLPQNSQVNYQQ
jgi:signal transduction histidine kinase